MSSVRVEQGSGGDFVMLSGDADLTLAGELERALEQCEAQPGEVVVDLSEATLLDSRVIGLLLASAERQRRTGGSLTLRSAGPDVRRLFTTLGLDREFRFA